MKHTLKIELASLEELDTLIEICERFQPGNSVDESFKKAWLDELYGQHTKLLDNEASNQEPSDGEAWSGGFAENH